MSNLKEQSAKNKKQNEINYDCDFFAVAQQHYHQGNYKDAITFFTQCIESNANLAKAYNKRGFCYFKELLASHCSNSGFWNEDEKEKNYKLALADYSEAIKLDSNYIEAYYNRAICYLEVDEYKNALIDFNKAIELNPKYVEAYYKRAICHSAQENYEIAILDFNKVIELKPEDVNAYYRRAMCYSNQENHKNALADFNETIRLNPEYSKAYAGRADCFKFNRNYDDAIENYKKAIELTSNEQVSFNDDHYCDLGNCYFKRGEYFFNQKKYELAFSDFDNAIENANIAHDEVAESMVGVVSNLAVSIRKYGIAKKYIEKYLMGKDWKSKNADVFLQNIDRAEKIEEKNKELNNLIAMFAHNFLGTLQCIRSNAEHDNNPKIHLKTVKMMSGALTAFSIISADDDKLIEQLKQDNTGETNLLQNLANNLALAISQLLSKTNKDKIINLYLNYLQKTAQIKPETNGEDLRFNENAWEKWNALQQQWEDEFNALFSENVELSRLQTWLETNFFPVQIIGFNNYTICFKEYGITDSIFLVVFMEILVNALKYTDVSKNKPLIITLCKENETYQLTCENPSAQESYRGTHKGMDFLKSIAKKVNGQFITESTEQSFKTTFIIPAELLE